MENLQLLQKKLSIVGYDRNVAVKDSCLCGRGPAPFVTAHSKAEVFKIGGVPSQDGQISFRGGSVIT